MSKNKKNIAIEFPNIFRFIPENKYLKKALKSKKLIGIASAISVLISILLLISIVFFGVSLYNSASRFFYIMNSRQEVKAKINFWQSISDKYDGYKDAYFQIAVLEYSLGDYTKAKEANLKSLLLDPNFSEARKLEALIESK